MRHLTSFIFVCLLASTSFAKAKLTHGPMVGGASSTSMRIWSRTSEPAKLHVTFGVSETDVSQKSRSSETKLDDDCTGWIQLSKLKPGTKYYYEVFVDDESAAKGTFKTLPSAADYVHKELNPDGLFNFRFEFACGNNQSPDHGNGPSLPTYNTLLRDVKDKVDFAILNGDWMYEESRDYSPAAWRKQMSLTKADSPRTVNIAPSTVGVWQNYKN